MAQTFKTGDLVQLKLGGQKMIVDYYKEPIHISELTAALKNQKPPEMPKTESVMVVCFWVDEKGKRHTREYHQDTLEFVK